MAYSFEALEDDYVKLIDKMEIKDSWSARIDKAARDIISGKNRYQNVADTFEKLHRQPIPWQFIGIIHHLEGACDFDTHLHNGDSLSHRTVNDPSGRPRTGEPPFTFEESALDALSQRDFRGVQEWSPAQLAYQFEAYNGFGYRSGHSGINSPYLWSGTNNYTSGKYVSDHVFNPDAVSKQCGAMGLLARIQALDIDKQQIKDGSRKLNIMANAKQVIAGVGGGGIVANALDIVPEKVKHFQALGLSKELWFLVGGGVIVYVLFTVLEYMTHQDYTKGNYTPSKAPENLFSSKVKL